MINFNYLELILYSPIHIEVGSASHDPLSELVPATSPQHHAGTVEAYAVVEAAHPRVLAHDRLVVGRERLRPAHRALDAGLKESVASKK